MKWVYTVSVVNDDELVELELFSTLEKAQEYEVEMRDLYRSDESSKISFWQRPIDHISPSSRLLLVNPVTGFKPTMGRDSETGKYHFIPWDDDFWKESN